jgi:hypothetical protein
MGGTGVIDRFLEVFTSYIDSGFGLLGSEVGFLAATLAAIDLTLAALFWAWGRDEDVVARLVKKTLFIGVFAYLIGNWNSLARIVFESFAGLGLKASGTGLSAAEFLRPGRVAQVGLDAGRPILDSISGLMGFVSFFENFIQIAVLLFAWVVVLLAFFILAVQLFITLIEFKLTTLAGFVLIPFGLFSKTAFLAERVLGNEKFHRMPHTDSTRIGRWRTLYASLRHRRPIRAGVVDVYTLRKLIAEARSSRGRPKQYRPHPFIVAGGAPHSTRALRPLPNVLRRQAATEFTAYAVRLIPHGPPLGYPNHP